MILELVGSHPITTIDLGEAGRIDSLLTGLLLRRDGLLYGVVYRPIKGLTGPTSRLRT